MKFLIHTKVVNLWIIGVLAATPVSSYAEEGVRIVAKDTNEDGRPDYWKEFLRDNLILREYDRNFDGKIDKRQLTDLMYHKATKMKRHLYIWKEEDNDYDGVIDVYRVRGTRDPKPTRVGQPMDEVQNVPRSEDTAVDRLVETRSQWEDLVSQSREQLE